MERNHFFAHGRVNKYRLAFYKGEAFWRKKIQEVHPAVKFTTRHFFN